MTKAWDIAELAAGLKAKGLDVAEDVAMEVAAEVLDWTKKSIVMSDTKFDDLALPFLPMVEGPLKELIDTIDGKKDMP